MSAKKLRTLICTGSAKVVHSPETYRPAARRYHFDGMNSKASDNVNGRATSDRLRPHVEPT